MSRVSSQPYPLHFGWLSEHSADASSTGVFAQHLCQGLHQTPLCQPENSPPHSGTPGSQPGHIGLWWSCPKALVSPSHGTLLVWPHLPWPPQQCQDCAKLFHARQPAVCPHWRPTEMSGQQVHGHKSHVNRQGLLTQLQDLKTGLGPWKPSRLLGLVGEGRRENAPAWDLVVLVPAAPLGSSFKGREPLNVCHYFYCRWSLPPTSGPAVGTGQSPWSAGTRTSQVQPRLAGCTAMALAGLQALAGQISAPVCTPSELQMQLESCQ